MVDRIRRAIAATSDSVSARVQPIAKAFGRAFGVDNWCAPVAPLRLHTVHIHLPPVLRVAHPRAAQGLQAHTARCFWPSWVCAMLRKVVGGWERGVVSASMVGTQCAC